MTEQTRTRPIGDKFWDEELGSWVEVVADGKEKTCLRCIYHLHKRCRIYALRGYCSPYERTDKTNARFVNCEPPKKLKKRSNKMKKLCTVLGIISLIMMIASVLVLLPGLYFIWGYHIFGVKSYKLLSGVFMLGALSDIVLSYVVAFLKGMLER
jgi:hypothetical protein